MLSQAVKLVRLCLSVTGAKQVYLMSTSQHGSRVYPMTSADREEWRADLRLTPGDYRLRYYVDDGQCVTYGGAFGERSIEWNRWDSVLRVSAEPELATSCPWPGRLSNCAE